MLCCCVLVAVTGSGKSPAAKRVLAEVGRPGTRNPIEREKRMLWFPRRPGSVEWGQIHGLWHKSMTTGSTLYIWKFSGQRVSPDQSFGCPLWPQTITFAFQKCLLQSVILHYVFNPAAGGSLLKCTSDHVASFLVLQDKFQFPYLGLGGTFDLILAYLFNFISQYLLLKSSCSTNIIVLS